MPDTRFVDDGDHVRFFCPYHPDFRSRAHNLGGAYQSTDRSWKFDGRDRGRVAELSRCLFGTTGDDTEWDDLITVNISAQYHEQDGQVIFTGRQIAVRQQRDWQVRLAPNVILAHGNFKQKGGSRQFPAVEADAHVVLQVRDLPRAALQIADVRFYTVEDTNSHVRTLQEERERLAQRLTRIDQELEQLGHP